MSDSKRITCFPSDKNGCGFYRTIIPLGYLSAKLEWDPTFMYQFVFDLNLIKNSHWVRFQRQCTENQIRCLQEYRNVIDKTNSPAKIMYELDDLVHGIEPHNILAYQFYTTVRRENVVKMMHMSNMVTFSTQFLKDFYETNFGVRNSAVVPNFLPKFLWKPKFDDKSTKNTKPTVMWAGSASHIGPGGDMEFLLPMIEATVDEFDWLFVGVVPQKLKGKVKFIDWANFYEYPDLMQSIKADIAIAPISNSLFNYGKSDLKYCEYAAMNIPSLLSSIGSAQFKGPYDLTNGNLVQNDPDSWYQAIKKLWSDENLKADTLKRQQEYVSRRWLENPENIALYQKVYA
jgi:glycosyltransferase involved in cell wall biosynthesis